MSIQAVAVQPQRFCCNQVFRGTATGQLARLVLWPEMKWLSVRVKLHAHGSAALHAASRLGSAHRVAV